MSRAVKRNEIRKLKRAVATESNTHAMVALLQRSVRLGHKRLALVRCIQAEHMGASIPAELLSYCRQIADQLPLEDLRSILGHRNSAVR